MTIRTRHIADAAITAGKIANDAVDSAQIVAGAVDKTHLSGGFLNVTLVAGQNETSDTTIPVTGLVAGDEIAAVIVLTTAASIASAASRAKADFTAGAGVVNVVANPADNTNNQYLIFWLDLT